jgi:hypothetical protein
MSSWRPATGAELKVVWSGTRVVTTSIFPPAGQSNAGSVVVVVVVGIVVVGSVDDDVVVISTVLEDVVVVSTVVDVVVVSIAVDDVVVVSTVVDDVVVLSIVLDDVVVVAIVLDDVVVGRVLLEVVVVSTGQVQLASHVPVGHPCAPSHASPPAASITPSPQVDSTARNGCGLSFFALTEPDSAPQPLWIFTVALTLAKVPHPTAAAETVVTPLFLAFGAWATMVQFPSATLPASIAMNAGRGVTSPMICSAPEVTT